MKNLKLVCIITFITIVCVTVVYELMKPKNIAANKRQEVVFWSLQMGTFSDYMQPLITEFETQNPDVKIKWIDVPYAEGEKRTLASILSNTPPDLVNLTPDFSSILAQKQALEYVDCTALKDYNKQIIEILKYDGKCYAIPFYATSALTLYNKQILEQAGIQSLPKSYDDLFGIASKIKEKTGAFVTMPTLTENDTFLKILNKYDVNNPDKVVSDKAQKIFASYKKLYQEDLIPKESITQNHQEALEKYMSGQIAFIQSGANFLNIVKENAPQLYTHTDISEQFVGDNGKYDVSVMNLIIPVKAKNKDGALKFALFLTNQKNQVELAKLTSILPVNNLALEDDYFKAANATDKIAKARFVSASQLSNLQTPIKFLKNQKEILTLLNSTVQQIVLDKVAIEEGLSQMQRQWKLME